MNIIELNNLKLKTFIERDAEDYCLLNNINPSDIIELYLFNNELTDISGIKLFKNLEKLGLSRNRLTDISVLKDLKNIKELFLGDNKITDISDLNFLIVLKNLNLFSNNIIDISVLKNLNELEYLNINNNLIKDISVIQYLTKLKLLDIRDLELESDQIEYINSCKNLKILYYENGFKDMSIIELLPDNIK